jgi:leucyl-tRNA synthetase
LDPHDIVGIHRSLQRLWRSVIDEHHSTPIVTDDPLPDRLRRALHATIDQLSHDLTELKFNTAIAHVTTLNNELAAVVRECGTCSREIAKPLLVMLAPFAPHITEELWYRLGHRPTIADVELPTADLALARRHRAAGPAQRQDPRLCDRSCRRRRTLHVASAATTHRGRRACMPNGSVGWAVRFDG